MTLDHAMARAAADDGMRRALQHAEAECKDWGDLAFRFLTLFCRRHHYFISEDVSAASKQYGLLQPPTDRAWGAVYRRAILAEMIVQDGAGRSKRRHNSICPRWRSTIYGQSA
jgi:hypothetical protein